MHAAIAPTWVTTTSTPRVSRGLTLARRVALPGALLLALTGCSGGDDDTSGDDTAGSTEPSATASTEPTETETPEPTSSEDSAMAGAATVMVGTTALGDVLVDSAGMTLYMFDPDAQGDSTCYEGCATAWPPLLTAGEPAAGDGADDSLLGTVERTDGTQQVTYDDWPLYYFAQDAAEGDVNGQSLNDVWWVLDADGQPVRG